MRESIEQIAKSGPDELFARLYDAAMRISKWDLTDSELIEDDIARAFYFLDRLSNEVGYEPWDYSNSTETDYKLALKKKIAAILSAKMFLLHNQYCDDVTKLIEANGYTSKSGQTDAN